jgi:hypothetical protein
MPEMYKPQRSLVTSVAVALAIGLLAAPAARAAGVSAVCQPLVAAVEKQVAIPMHAYMTHTITGKVRTSEVIYSGKAIYVKTNGSWTRSPITPQDMQNQQAENIKRAKETTCTYLRDEPVNGEAAAVYSTHGASEYGKSDSTIWLSKSRGVPLRMEMDMDVGGAGGKSHMSMRYDYDKVTAPAGVK